MGERARSGQWRAGSMNIRKRCASGARRSSSLWQDQGPDGRNPLPDEDTPRVATEMALHVLAYNLTRAINIMGVQLVLAAIRA